MDLKHLTAKAVSVSLIFFGLYQVYLSINSIFFIYPRLAEGAGYSRVMQEGLFQKAIFIYLSMIIDGVYGFALFLKPAHEIKIMHIVTGAVIGTVSFIFTFRSSASANFVMGYLNQITSLL